MQLVYKPIVIKQVKKLPKKEKIKIVEKLELLQKKPHSGKKLKGELDGLYSFRAWPYRIIYSIDSSTIVVYSIAHRQGAY